MATLKQVILCSKRSLNRHLPLLTPQRQNQRSGFGEVAGGSAAECTAVACCCPCVLANLVVLVVYRLPVGLCKRALRQRRRRRLAKKGLLPIPVESEEVGGDEVEWRSKRRRRYEEGSGKFVVEEEEETVVGETEMRQLEKEMWDHFFYRGGFWRSSSLNDPT